MIFLISLNSSFFNLYIVYGFNVGACSAAILSSMGANRTAKQIALSNLLISCFGATIMTLITALLPLLITYLIVSMISKGMQENVGSFVNVLAAPKNELSDEEKQTVSKANTEDDYIFISGKMIKNPNKK